MILTSLYHETPQEHRRLAYAGLTYIVVVVALISLSLAVYGKAFSHTTDITIKADRAGLQLARFGDVRIDGALIGQVRSVTQDGEHASIEVALEPDAARAIPDNVDVQIMPTTLFGQKFVQLVRPKVPSGSPLRDGYVIPASRVSTNVELSRVLANLFTILRAVDPADLNNTLNALSTALDGRGERLGRTAERLNRFLASFSDDLPVLEQDLDVLADVADTYAQAAPDIIGVLRNATTTSRTISANKDQLAGLFRELRTVSDDGYTFIDLNGDALVRTFQLGQPVLRLLATYSPELPCLLIGLDKYRTRLLGIFRDGKVHQKMFTGTPQYHAYTPQERPVYGEVGHGPWCLGLPSPKIPADPQSLDDGTLQDDNPPTSPFPPLPGGRYAPTSSGFAGTTGDKAIINALMAGNSGRPADSYGSLPALMFGPVVRGSA